MTPERWQRVKEVFSQASELAADAQRALLVDIQREDSELHAEVASLLAAHRTHEAIVDVPAIDYLQADSIDNTDNRIGRRIGNYQLLALLGSGGMGDVFRASRADAQFEKQVAIKLVRGYSPDFVLQRFKAERQILASLEHPNIARLLDGGATDEGSPYLVMELVEGQPIDRYCETHQLSIDARLKLFRDVCSAVGYAHQHLVVHRDLKPSNILVTDNGTIKLLDFGIAKLLHATPNEVNADATLTTMRALTPAYSSPEQMLGLPITTASDVYSLGVVLYHLLTGRSPYRTTLVSTQDAIREVCETEPIKPSVAVTKSPSGQKSFSIPERDLDDIVLKALRKEPEKRYHSVEQLSEDVQRYLDDQPVIAHGDRFSYRTGKFIRRHKFELAAALLIAMTLLGGIVVATHEAHIAQLEKQRAERDFARVRKLANTLMFELHDAIADLPGSTPARQLLVKNALLYLDELSKEDSSDDELNRELAAAYRRVGDIQGGYGGQSTGDTKAAVASYRKGVAQLERVVAKHPDNLEARAELGRGLRRLGLGEYSAGNIEGSVLTVRRATQVVAQVLASDRENTKYLHEMAAADSDYCAALTTAGKFDAAFTACRKSIVEQELVVQKRPQDRKEMRVMSVVYSRMSKADQDYFSQDQRDLKVIQEAVTLLRKVLAVDQHLVDSDANDELAKRDLAGDYCNLAGTLVLARDKEGAVEAYSKAIELFEKLIASDPDNVASRINLALTKRNLGSLYVDLKQIAPAFENLNAALKILDALSPQQENIIANIEHAAALLGIANAHAIVASDTHQPVATNLKEWRAAQSNYEASLNRYNEQLASGGIDAAFSHDIDEATAGLAKSKSAIAKLTHAAVSAFP